MFLSLTIYGYVQVLTQDCGPGLKEEKAQNDLKHKTPYV